jgi:hypothetical protein
MFECISSKPQQHGVFTKFKQKEKVYCKDSVAIWKGREGTLVNLLLHKVPLGQV